MTDDVARDPADFSAATGQSDDRPKRSRRRGRRSKSKPMDGQNAPIQAAPEATRKASAEPARAVPVRGGRRTGAARGGYIPFNDGLDRFVCLDCLRFLPLTYPVQHRRGTATIALREVARRESEILLCNGLHAGPCLWPDGVVVESPAPIANGATPEPDDRDATVMMPDDDVEQTDLSAAPSAVLEESAELPASAPAMQLTESP